MCVKKLLYKCSETNSSDYGLLISRLALGFFMFYHGAQKVGAGYFGGKGYDATMGFLTGEMIGLPAFFAFLVIFGEFAGGLAMMLGLRVRPAAVAFIAILIGAIITVHIGNGFSGQGGFELHVLGIAMSITLLINGGGAYSLDSVVKKWFKSDK